jgi:GR25 family glycosyltransferase involved in LPS biosynthesis
MRIICITVNDDNYVGKHRVESRPISAVRRHFEERGVEAEFFYGIHAPKLGIGTSLTYEVDNPGSNFNIGAENVGCWLSHRALWAACLLLPEDMFFIVEDDAVFPPDWRKRVDDAIRDAGDFDILCVGSCCAADKPATHVAGNVYEVRYPFCTHGYIVRKSALHTLIRTQDEARLYAPIDISVVFHSLPHLKTRTVKPRILDQSETEIAP